MSVREAFDLTGRTALVTGGSRGLGLAMAGALGEMGAKVVISARKADELDAAVENLKRDRGVTAVRVIAETPLRQLGEPADLEGLVVLLSSAAARHITGQIIAVDGGASVV